MLRPDCDWRACGEATVRGSLYDLGPYPGLVDDGTDTLVPGALYEVWPSAAALDLLDSYEGIPDGLFRRREVAVEDFPGGDGRAWCYLYARSLRGARRIEHW